MFLILFCLSLILHADQPINLLPSDKLIQLYVSVTNNNIPSQSIDSQIKTPINVHVEQKSTIVHYVDHIKDCAHNAYTHYLSLTRFFHEHPVQTLCATLLTSWISSAMYCLYAEYYICRYLNWVHWKSELSSCALHQIPIEQLQKDLLTDIQKYYQLQNNLNDFFSPLVYFFNDIHQEMIFLQRFIRLRTCIKNFHLTKLYPSQTQALSQAETFLERITFLKQIISSWLAHYKIDNYMIHA